MLKNFIDAATGNGVAIQEKLIVNACEFEDERGKLLRVYLSEGIRLPWEGDSLTEQLDVLRVELDW